MYLPWYGFIIPRFYRKWQVADASGLEARLDASCFSFFRRVFHLPGKPYSTHSALEPRRAFSPVPPLPSVAVFRRFLPRYRERVHIRVMVLVYVLYGIPVGFTDRIFGLFRAWEYLA